MECESPNSANQLRAAGGGSSSHQQQVSLGYTRAQVHAPLPHSHSQSGSESSQLRGSGSGGWSASGDPGSPPQMMRLSGTSSSGPGTSRQSSVNASHRHSSSTHHHSGQSPHSGGGGGPIPISSTSGPPSAMLVHPSMHYQAAPHAQRQTDRDHPPVAVLASDLNAPYNPTSASLDATQRGSMNIPLYNPQTVTSSSAGGVMGSGGGSFQTTGSHIYQAVPPQSHHHHGNHHQSQTYITTAPSFLATAAGGGGGVGVMQSDRGGLTGVATSLNEGPVTRGGAVTLNERLSGDSGSSALVRTTAAGERNDDSPMVGVCVQQSPVASH